MIKFFHHRKFFWIVLLILVVAFALAAIFKPFKSELISPLSKTPFTLKDVVVEMLNGAKGIYAITIKNLKTGETYSKNEHQIFETGSLYKLWIMAAVFKQIEEGQLTEDQVLEGDAASLNNKFNIEPSQAELTEGTVTMTVAEALKQMITISHNSAALLLTEKIGLVPVANFLKENGFRESAVGIEGEAPKSTTADMALFLEKLYKGELANQEFTDKMINLLKDQQLNEGLPKYLPDQPRAAHKTGDIGWFKHDAGIVFSGKGDYIIAVMSKSDYPPGAQERIALISKAVYEYFTR